MLFSGWETHCSLPGSHLPRKQKDDVLHLSVLHNQLKWNPIQPSLNKVQAMTQYGNKTCFFLTPLCDSTRERTRFLLRRDIYMMRLFQNLLPMLFQQLWDKRKEYCISLLRMIPMHICSICYLHFLNFNEAWPKDKKTENKKKEKESLKLQAVVNLHLNFPVIHQTSHRNLSLRAFPRDCEVSILEGRQDLA